MPAGSSDAFGLRRDLLLIRRRAWIFIPFLLLGILLALLFGRVSGDANAVASMQLETVVHTVTSGGDRGLRIFEAQSMTTDDRFKEMVRQQAGDPNLDYSRYSISLAPISVADGVARGILTVSVKDPKIDEANRLRQAWVDVFQREYEEPDGLFRTRYLDTKQQVVDDANRYFEEAMATLAPEAEKRGLPVDELVRSRVSSSFGLAPDISTRESEMQAMLAEIEAALQNPSPSSTVASAILGTTVPEGQARAVLTEQRDVLTRSIAGLREERAAISDATLDSSFLAMLDEARFAAEIKDQSYVHLNAARVAVSSAESDAEVSYSTSGGVAGTNVGRVAVVIAVTLVFGLIAIYLLEWLSQIRESASPAPKRS